MDDLDRRYIQRLIDDECEFTALHLVGDLKGGHWYESEPKMFHYRSDGKVLEKAVTDINYRFEDLVDSENNGIFDEYPTSVLEDILVMLQKSGKTIEEFLDDSNLGFDEEHMIKPFIPKKDDWKKISWVVKEAKK